MARVPLGAILLLALFVLAPASAQLSANVEVLGIQFGPPTTFYGEYRTYSATVVGLGLSGGFSGTLDFICNNKVIAQAPLQPLAGVQVTYQQLAPALQVTLLNNYLTSSVINPLLQLAILTLTGGLPITAAVLNAPLIQSTLQSLSPVTVDAAAIATTTIATTPVGTCTSLTVAYVGVTLGNQPVLGAPTLNPLLPIAAFTFTVNPAPTSTALSSPLVSVPVGGVLPVTVTVLNTDAASVLPPDGGTVAVYVYSTTAPFTVLGTGTVVNPGTGKSATVAISLDTTTYPVGPLTLGAAYSGDTDFQSSIAAAGYGPISVTASGTSPIGASTTPPTSSMPPPSSGAVTLTPNAVPPPTYINGALTVSGKATSPSGVPTGSVSVQKNGVPAGTAPLDATGSFSLPETASGVPGVDVYTISYAPTGGVFQPATTTLNVPVTLPPTTFTIGAMPNPAPAGTPTLISGTVTAANGGIPTGTVTVVVDGVPAAAPVALTPGTTGSTYAVPITAPAAVGPHTVTLAYIPGAGFAGPATQPTTTLTSGPATTAFTLATSPNPVPAGAPLTVAGTASASNSLPPNGTVQVLIDGTPVGSPSALVPGTNSSTYSLTVPAPGTVGNHTVSIAYTPGAGFAAPGLLPSTTITVGPATTAFAITTVPSPASAGGPLNVTGVATSTNGPPTGTVQVLIDGTPVGSPVPLVPGTTNSTFSVPTIAPGTVGNHTITLAYVPGPGFVAPVPPPSAGFTVGPAPPIIAVTITPSPSPPGGTVTVSGNVTSTGTGVPSGTVSVTVGGTVVGTGTVTPAGTFSVTFFGPTTPGTYPLVVTFTPSPGSNTGGGSYVTSLAVGNGTGSNSPGLTISFGNGAGSETLAFPHCLSPFSVGVATTAAAGLNFPTGNLSLSFTGGALKFLVVTFDTTEPLVKGAATFTINSNEVKQSLIKEARAKLEAPGAEGLKGIVPKGHILLLPGSYTLMVSYPGDANYAAATASLPFTVDITCGLADLSLA